MTPRIGFIIALCAGGCATVPPPAPAPIVIVNPVQRYSIGHLPAYPKLASLINNYNAASDAGLTFAMRPDTSAEQVNRLRELDHAARTAIERCRTRGATKAKIAAATDAIKQLRAFTRGDTK